MEEFMDRPTRKKNPCSSGVPPRLRVSFIDYYLSDRYRLCHFIVPVESWMTVLDLLQRCLRSLSRESNPSRTRTLLLSTRVEEIRYQYEKQKRKQNLDQTKGANNVDSFIVATHFKCDMAKVFGAAFPRPQELNLESQGTARIEETKETKESKESKESLVNGFDHEFDWEFPDEILVQVCEFLSPPVVMTVCSLVYQ